MNKKSEIKDLENYFDELGMEIVKNEKELKSIKKEIEDEQGEKEIQESRIAYYDILIKELCEKFGEEGKEMFKEMFPEDYEEVFANSK